MNVALVLYELSLHSYQRGEVWGEEIDAICMRRAFLRRDDVTVCDLLTMNSYLALCEAGAARDYDLAIHFFEPSVRIPGAKNVLMFQQFYDLDRHDIEQLTDSFDRVFTASRVIAETFRAVGYLPLAVDGDLYHPVAAADESFRSEAVFIGNAHIREMATYRELLSPLMRYDLAVYGARWDVPEYQEWSGCWRGVLPLAKARDAYAGCSVALSIHNRRYLNDLLFVTARPFHSLACGRATVSDSNTALLELLPPAASGLRHAADGSQFGRYVRELLANRQLNDELGQLGREFVLRHHSWDVRIRELLNAL